VGFLLFPRSLMKLVNDVCNLMGQIRSAPVAIVTIAGHLGAVGGIPARVAEELGYLLADRRLLTQAAGTLGWSEPQAEAYDERTDAQRGRMSQFLSEFVHLAPFTPIDDIDAYTLESLALGAYGDWVASAEMRPADRRFLGVLTALVKGLAEAGDVVIVGRGSQAILGDRNDAVHVQVVCDLEERVRRIAERDSIEAAALGKRAHPGVRSRAEPLVPQVLQCRLRITASVRRDPEHRASW